VAPEQPVDELFPVIKPPFDITMVRLALDRGYSLRAIAKKLGTSKTSLWKFASKHGLASKYAKKKLA
jgi:transposase-like protein